MAHTIPPEQFAVLRAWLDEVIWLAPDELLGDLRALADHIGDANSFTLDNAQRDLLIAYLDFLCDRDTADAIADHVTLKNILAQLSNEG